MAYGSINVPGVSKKELLDAVEGKQDKITSGTTLIPPGSAWKTDTDTDYPNYVDSLPSIPALTANDRVDIIITESADKALAVKYGFSPVITLNSSNKPVIRAKDKPGSSEMIMSARYMITKGAGKYGTLTYGAESRPVFLLKWYDPDDEPATPEQNSENIETIKKILECGLENCTVYLRVPLGVSVEQEYIVTVPIQAGYINGGDFIEFKSLIDGGDGSTQYYEVDMYTMYYDADEQNIEYERYPLIAYSENSSGLSGRYPAGYVAPSIHYMEEYVAKKIKEALGK